MKIENKKRLYGFIKFMLALNLLFIGLMLYIVADYYILVGKNKVELEKEGWRIEKKNNELTIDMVFIMAILLILRGKVKKMIEIPDITEERIALAETILFVVFCFVPVTLILRLYGFKITSNLLLAALFIFIAVYEFVIKNKMRKEISENKNFLEAQ